MIEDDAYQEISSFTWPTADETEAVSLKEKRE